MTFYLNFPMSFIEFPFKFFAEFPFHCPPNFLYIILIFFFELSLKCLNFSLNFSFEFYLNFSFEFCLNFLLNLPQSELSSNFSINFGLNLGLLKFPSIFHWTFFCGFHRIFRQIFFWTFWQVQQLKINPLLFKHKRFNFWSFRTITLHLWQKMFFIYFVSSLLAIAK